MRHYPHRGGLYPKSNVFEKPLLPPSIFEPFRRLP